MKALLLIGLSALLIASCAPWQTIAAADVTTPSTPHDTIALDTVMRSFPQLLRLWKQGPESLQPISDTAELVPVWYYSRLEIFVDQPGAFRQTLITLSQDTTTIAGMIATDPDAFLMNDSAFWTNLYAMAALREAATLYQENRRQFDYLAVYNTLREGAPSVLGYLSNDHLFATITLYPVMSATSAK